MKVTLAMILGDESYTPLPGTEYEVADDIFAKLRRMTPALVEDWDRLTTELKAVPDAEKSNPDSEHYGMRSLIRQVQLVTDAPGGLDWDNKEAINVPILRRVVQDFLSL